MHKGKFLTLFIKRVEVKYWKWYNKIKITHREHKRTVPLSPQIIFKGFIYQTNKPFNRHIQKGSRIKYLKTQRREENRPRVF